MGHQLEEIQFCIPISILQTLSTAVKKQQRNHFVYEGSICSLGGAQVDCLFTAEILKQEDRIKLTFASPEGFSVDDEGRTITCDPTGLLLQNDADGEIDGEEYNEEDSVNVSETELPSPPVKRKRGRPRKKQSSPRVASEKVDTKRGKSYDIGEKSENEESVESDDEEDMESERSEEINSTGRRTRTRVIRKPKKYLSTQETPKGTRGRPSLKNRGSGSGTPHRGLQMPPVTPKAALMNSMQLKPVTSSKTGQTQMYLLNSPAQLIEKDGRKQLILPPGAKPISNEEATKMSDTLKSKGSNFTSLTPGLKGSSLTGDASIENVDDEDADPDWEPNRDDDEETVAGGRKRKGSDIGGTTPKSARMTPTGRRFGKLKNSFAYGRQYLNTLPKTPLVKITTNDENKDVWDDHDYLRQRDTGKTDAYSNLRTSRNSRKSNPKKTDSPTKTTEEEEGDKENDDVDDGMDFQETFSKQLIIPTVYNMYQVTTDYLKLKDKMVAKRPHPQKPKEVELNQVPRVFGQITFSSKGRPLRIQVRKKKDQIEKERLKKKQQDDKDEDDEEDDSEDDEDEDDDEEEVAKKTQKETVAKGQKKDEPVDGVIHFDDMVEDVTVTDNQDFLGGQFVPVDENGEEIKFLDENGEAINLFDEQGNMRELYTEDGNLIQFVTEEGEAIHAIETEPVDFSNYDPSLKVESFDSYDEFFVTSEDYDPKILELDEDEFTDLPVEEIEDVPGRPKRSNGSANNIPCEICCNFFLNHSNLLVHVRSKHRKDKGFQSFENRIKERMKVKCDICDAAAMSDLKLMEHMQKVHKIEAGFKCKTCCKSFLLKKRLLQHEKKVHCSIDQLCHLCPAVFKNPRSLERHIEMHKSGSWDKLQEKKFCPYCKRKFETAVSLQNHIKNRHSGESDNAHIIKCWSCDSEFATAKELRKHMIAEHVLHWHKYHCTLCKKVFDSMDELTKHKAQVHSGGIALHCPFCGIGYMARHTLISHISNNHLNRETPYKCPFCPSKFIRAVFLQKHIGVVHDLVAEVEVRKGSCDDQSEEKSTSKKCVFEECDKTFVREKDVVEHILDSHHDHFPHECEICGQRFAKLKYVISHSHAAHKTKPLYLPEGKDENSKEESSSPTASAIQPLPGPVAKKTITINPMKTVASTSITPGKVMVSQPAQTTQTPLSAAKAPAPRRTILLDTSGQAIGGAYHIQSNVVTRPVETATTKVVQMKPQTAVHTVTNPSLLTQGRSLLAKHVTAAKVPQVVQQETIFTDAAVVAEQSDDASQIQQQYAIVQTLPDNQQQYTEYVIDTSGADQQVQQNVDVEQIVYNLNVETNPRAWHYSRMEDHAATLTISQEQTAVMAGDQQSSINVVSAEELWRIINENIDS